MLDKWLVLQLNPDEPSAIHAKITALIKCKHFDQALEATNGKEKELSFERAYILHRQGKNKEALECVQQFGDKEDLKVKHLLTQIVSIDSCF